jgi:hypothetical protein
MRIGAGWGFLGLLMAVQLSAQELPEGWVPIGNALDRYTLNVISEGYNGQGLSVVGKEATGNFGGVGQMVLADNYRNRTVRLSGYLQTIDVDGVAGLWMRIDGKDEMIALDNMLARGPKGNTPWQEYSIVLRVPDAANQIVFGALLSGNGELRADELKLEIVTDDTPTTAVPAARTTPQNLSF